MAGLTPHEGSISYRGEQGRHGIAAARASGVRCVFQELSLCPNLTISENVRIMHAAISGRNWRGRALIMIRQTLDEIFPGHGIDCEPDDCRTFHRRAADGGNRHQFLPNP